MPVRVDLVKAIVAKDLRVFLRDRFYVLVTVMGLVFYVLVFWLLPDTVDESIGLGVHIPGGEQLIAQQAGAGGGFQIVPFESREALEAAVTDGSEVAAGLDFPEGFLEQAATGEETTVRVVLSGGAPEELRPALVGGVREIVAAIGGGEPPVALPTMSDVVLGPDRTGQQLSMRERMQPLLVFLVLIVEMFALASLVAAEIAQKTVTAVLATPTRVRDLLAAKATLGTGLAFVQAMAIALATGALLQAPLLLTVALLLGAILVTGFGLIAGASGRDFISIVFWSLLFAIPLTIPAVAVLFPGAAADWVRGLPTYGLVETIVGVTAYGEGWAQAWRSLGLVAVWCVVAFVMGLAVLSRRVERV